MTSYKEWQQAAKANAPTAEVLGFNGTVATIRCPLCNNHHRHDRVQIGALEHRPAACDLYHPLNREQRAAGYVFTVYPRTGDNR